MWEQDGEIISMNKTVYLCESYVKRLWGVDTKCNGINCKGPRSINEPTRKFDECGLYDENGNVVIPSKTPKYQNAESFLRTIGIPLMSGYTIKIYDDATDPEP